MRIANIFLLCFLILGVCMMAENKSDKTHPFSVHDMVAMDRISDPQVSPDGARIVFVLRKTDMDANRGRTDLWLVNLDGSGLRRLTTHSAGDFNPRWSACGKSVWFLSTRSGSSQVWRISVEGGEACQITDLPLDAGNLIVSPDGKHVAFTLEVFPKFKTIQETVDKLDAVKNSKVTGRIYDRIFVRHWDTWKDGRRSHIFVLPICIGKSAGEPVDIMAGMDADSPSKPFGGTEEFTFTTDGLGMVFTAKDVGRIEAWSTNWNLFLAPTDGSKSPEKLTADDLWTPGEKNRAWDTTPSFSPDGKTLAYLAMKEPGYEADRFRIVLRSWPDGKDRILTEGWDRSPSSITWSSDGKTIYATASNLGQRSLFAVDAKTGKTKVIVKDGAIGSPSAAGDRIVYGMDSLKSPVELYSVRPDGSDIQRITGINDSKVASIRWGEPEQFTFKGWNDETVYCYVVKPVDFDENKKYPISFLIHGGPQGSFGNHFHYRWNPQAYTGAGYAVVMVDFHGSSGYGQAFTDSIQGDWGGKPLVDLQKGLAAALDKYKWLDGEKVGALGASYGGYMINWIAGNWPDRFKCLICHDGNLDERMAYFDTEELWFPERDHEGTPWSNPEGYAKHNPVEFVHKWKTPMLVIHGALDFRVVDTQGLSTFNALQRLGIPSKLLYFPDENHWVLQPHNSIFWHDTVIGWLNQWVK